MSQPLACALVVFPHLRWNNRWVWQSQNALLPPIFCPHTSEDRRRPKSCVLVFIWAVSSVTSPPSVSFLSLSLLRRRASAWFLLKLGNHLSWQCFNATPPRPPVSKEQHGNISAFQWRRRRGRLIIWNKSLGGDLDFTAAVSLHYRALVTMLWSRSLYRLTHRETWLMQ